MIVSDRSRTYYVPISVSIVTPMSNTTGSMQDNTSPRRSRRRGPAQPAPAAAPREGGTPDDADELSRCDTRRCRCGDVNSSLICAIRPVNHSISQLAHLALDLPRSSLASRSISLAARLPRARSPWQLACLALDLPHSSLASRSIIRRSKTLIRGQRRSSEVIRRSKALIARAGAKRRPGRRP